MQPITQAQVKKWLPVRDANAHKGCFGRVLVIAGSRGMCGAGFLCAKSALAAGAGLVYWALPASMQPAFAAALPEVITLPLPEDEHGQIDASAWELFPDICVRCNPSLVIAGPGMGQSLLLPLLIDNCSLPLVLDADGLNALSAQTAWHTRWPANRPAVLTPHAAEMARLLGTSPATQEPLRLNQVTQLAQLTQSACLLKGPRTLVAAEFDTNLHVVENTTGTVALAKAGSGDVLGGLIAGLWAQLGSAQGFSVHSAYQASVCGVYLHGLAGELAAGSKGIYSVLASDTLACVPGAFRQVQEDA